MMSTEVDAVDDGIVVEELTKRYDHRAAVDNVSIEVRRGSVLALLGPNGAGKTTLVRMLTTLIRPDRGRALVASYDVVADAPMVRRAIGLVGQHAAVDEYLTGRENLTLVARLLRFDRVKIHERIGVALEMLSLADVADANVATYSGGMRRRLDLAVTLLARPAVLFLDEPTTGLDPASRRELWALIDQLVAGGTTVLLTTQYLEEADRLADTVAVIDHGRLIASGTPDSLKARLNDAVHIRFADPTVLGEAAAAFDNSAIAVLIHDQTSLELRAPNGAALLPEALRRLDGRGLTVIAAEVRRPALDDVFLALTGERAVPGEMSEAQDATPKGWAHHRRTRSYA